MALVGQSSVDISQKSVTENLRRLINQVYKLIPMREHEEDWQKQLNSVIIEVAGLHEIFYESATFLQILLKLQGLKSIETDFDIYRKTVFECLNLLQELSHEK